MPKIRLGNRIGAGAFWELGKGERDEVRGVIEGGFKYALID